MTNSILRITAFALPLLFPVLSSSQTNPQPPAPAPVAIIEIRLDAAKPDPQIADALKRISAEHIRATIEKLVTFKNRNTLSSNDQEMISQGLGVTAAAKWIQEEFERYSQACGGCLQVKTDSFTQPVAPRVPTPFCGVDCRLLAKGARERGSMNPPLREAPVGLARQSQRDVALG